MSYHLCISISTTVFLVGVSFAQIGCGDTSGKVKSGDVKSGSKQKATGAGFNSVAYRHDGKRIVSGGNDGSVEVWDAEKGTRIRSLNGHRNRVFSVAYSHDGKRIVSGSGDPVPGLSDQIPPEVKVWNAETGEEIHTLTGHIGTVYAVAFSPDGKRMVSGGGDSRRAGNSGELKLWDVEKGIEVDFSGEHFAVIHAVAYSPDGKRIASLSQHHVKIWDVEKGNEVKDLRARSGSTGDQTLNTLAYNSDGTRLVGAGHGPMYIWNTESGEQIMTLKGHTKWVRSVAFSPDGGQIVSGGDDSMVRVWNVEKGKEQYILKGHIDKVRCVAFSPDGNRILSTSDDSTTKVWDAKKRTVLLSLSRE